MPFIKQPDFNCHYESQHNGEVPIICIHGNFGSWRYWQPFFQHLPEGYCAYAPDLRGCGDSDIADENYDIQTLSDDVLFFANQLKLEKFHLVGHSLGGAVAQELAGHVAERVLSLTLVAPAPAEGLASLEKSNISSQFFSAKNIFQFLDNMGMKKMLFTATFKKTMPGLKNKPAYLNNVVSDAIKMDIKAFNGFYETLKTWRGNDLLKRFTFPVLIIHGSLDTVVPLKPLERMQQQIQGCRLHIFEKIGHSPQLESPTAFNNLVNGFIQDSSSIQVINRTTAPEQPNLAAILKRKLKQFLSKFN